MPTTITINVTNNSNTLQNFFFFQAPGAYSGGAQIFSNSLYTSPLLPFSSSNSTLTFSLVLQYYAGVQDQAQAPTTGQPSGTTSAMTAIGLTPAQGGEATNNTTNMTVTPALGLSSPTNTSGPEAGSFRIVTPIFNDTLQQYNAGSAASVMGGGVTLSNFVTAQPSTNIDCQPVLQFYVATGTFTAGSVMDFTASSAVAALCDATTGNTVFDVSYTDEGTWTVTPYASNTMFSIGDKGHAMGTSRLADKAQNAAILNEFGNNTLAVGRADSFRPPVIVKNLTPANPVQLLSEYQVGPIDGPYKGRMCTSVNQTGTEATFS